MHHLRGFVLKWCFHLDGTSPSWSVFTSDIITVVTPEHTAHSTVAYKKNSSQEYYAANSTGFSLEEETSQVEDHEHNMGLEKRRVHWFRNQQYRDKPLETIHLIVWQSNIISPISTFVVKYSRQWCTHDI